MPKFWLKGGRWHEQREHKGKANDGAEAVGDTVVGFSAQAQQH
jgi:hypothetical protein